MDLVWPLHSWYTSSSSKALHFQYTCFCILRLRQVLICSKTDMVVIFSKNVQGFSFFFGDVGEYWLGLAVNFVRTSGTLE